MLALLGSVVSYWTFEQGDSVTSVESDTTMNAAGVPAKKFAPGNTVFVYRKLISSRDITHNRVWRVVVREENQEVVLREFLPTMPIIKGTTIRTHRVQIPDDAKPGVYRVYIYAKYALNPLRNVTYEIGPALKFEVVQ